MQITEGQHYRAESDEILVSGEVVEVMEGDNGSLDVYIRCTLTGDIWGVNTQDAEFVRVGVDSQP